VTVQYRLGVLGFPYVYLITTMKLTSRLENSFAEQGLTNLGLQDVVLALEWVQKNINSFGGDPTKVSLRLAIEERADHDRSP